MRRDALFSPCGHYRYRLTRVWDDRPPLVFVMLNPSRADAEIDDPTMRRCIGFAERLGFGGMTALNLFAWRTPYPPDLRAVADPVGPDNDMHLMDAMRSGRTIVAAWGVHGALAGRDRMFRALAWEVGAPLSCLGITKDGHPRHPLYLRNSHSLAEFDGQKSHGR